MTISLYTASVPMFTKILKNERTWLDKAAAHAEHKKFDSSVFMHARLAPDMFAFSRQIQSTSDSAKGCVARIAGVDIPRMEDTEQSLADLQTRLDRTVAFLDTIKPEQIDGQESREIIIKSQRGERRFIAEDYLRFYALPNFYFHATTAYAILRHNGVELGKTDFLAGAG